MAVLLPPEDSCNDVRRPAPMPSARLPSCLPFLTAHNVPPRQIPHRA